MSGTVGLKTGFGRWSLKGIVPLSPTLDTAGILTRSVADSVYAFAALDPAWGSLAALEQRIGGLDPSTVRIGLGDTCMWNDCDPGIAEAVKTALDELARCGVSIIEMSLPEAGEAMDLLRSGSVVSAECDAFLESELPELRPHLDPIITSRIADGGSIPAREFLLRQQRLRRLAQHADEKLATLDVIAAPTVPITPPRLTEVERIEDYRRLNMLSLRNTCVGNFLRLCGLSIPVGLDRAGLPVGLQLLARHGHEERLLAVGLALENILGTARQRLGVPPLCGGCA